MRNKNLTRIDIAKKISKELGFSLIYSKKLVDDIINIFSQQIAENDLILKNIGSFSLINKNERVGRNPITKVDYVIRRRKSISFTASKNLLKKINL
mgnify:CR=1 FL=1